MMSERPSGRKATETVRQAGRFLGFCTILDSLRSPTFRATETAMNRMIKLADDTFVAVSAVKNSMKHPLRFPRYKDITKYHTEVHTVF